MKTYFYLIFLFYFPISLHAQISVGLHGQYNQTLLELNEEGYRNGVGLNLDIMYGDFSLKIPATWSVGLQVDFNHHGGEGSEIQLNTGESATLRMRNQHVGIFGAYRLMSPYAPVRVYADGLIGTRIFYSQDVFRIDGAEDADVQGVSNGFTFSYGGAIGLLIEINEEVSIDTRVRYTTGSWARYVDLETVELDNDQLIYDFQRSSTDMLIFQVGVSLWLDSLY